MFCPHIIKSVFSYLTVLICKRFYTVFLDYKSNCFKSELGLNSMKKHDELDFSIVNFPFFDFSIVNFPFFDFSIVNFPFFDFSIVNFPFFDFSIVNFPFFLTCGIRIVFFVVVLILFTVNTHCLFVRGAFVWGAFVLFPTV